MRRRDAWSLAYRRNPYLRSWNYEELRGRWDDLSVIGILPFMKDCPVKPSEPDIVKLLEELTHLIDEFAHRGLPNPLFKLEPGRVMTAARRIGVSSIGLRWLERLLDHKGLDT